jgi:hypothetical protein
MHSSFLRWRGVRSLYGSRFIQNAPYRFIWAVHRKDLVRGIAGRRVSDHLGRHAHRQSSVCVERMFAFKCPGQYRPIGMGDSHGTLIDLRLPIEYAPADILDFSLDKTLFRSAHSKAYEVAIGNRISKWSRQAAMTSFPVLVFWLGKDQKPGVIGLSLSCACARVGVPKSPAVRTAARKASARLFIMPSDVKASKRPAK